MEYLKFLCVKTNISGLPVWLGLRQDRNKVIVSVTSKGLVTDTMKEKARKLAEKIEGLYSWQELDALVQEYNLKKAIGDPYGKYLSLPGKKYRKEGLALLKALKERYL